MYNYKMMRTINRLLNAGVENLNKEDAERIFEHKADRELKEMLENHGCDVIMVADLFNAQMPIRKFTRDELRYAKHPESIEIECC